MDVKFYIQDPTRNNTSYLYEAIVEAAIGSATWQGIFAFASANGVTWLFEEPAIDELLSSGGEVDILVGIDAVTNRQTLERLQALEQRYTNFIPRIFWHNNAGLFHPKISYFTYPEGRQTLVVGSGNLTPGGLKNNFEGYTVISTDSQEMLDVSDLDEFLEHHTADIHRIDDNALERAERNVSRPIGPTRHVEREGAPSSQQPSTSVSQGRNEGSIDILDDDRILLAQVPRAGGRWSQVHFNADVVRQFFRVTNREVQRAFLTQVRSDGSRAGTEIRPCVRSRANRNHRIEFSAATGLAYPQEPPILVLRELQLRVFEYMLIMPGDDGFSELSRLVNQLPSVGRGVRRAITEVSTLQTAWPSCPLLGVSNAESRDV